MAIPSINYIKFGAVFLIYVAYVLFRRLPIVFLSQIRSEIEISNDDIASRCSQNSIPTPRRANSWKKIRKGVLQSVLLITREEGARAFWKGHIPAQGLSATYGLVQFSSFEWLSRHAAKYIPSDDQSVRSTSDFVCGALSGCLAMTAAMPLDVIRTRLVAQKSGHAVYSGTMHAVKHIWEKEGVPGYFRGWIPSVVQIAPFTGMQFALYNCFMDLWPFTGYESTGALFSGAMAGTVAKTVLYPLDMVRHRLQMNGFERAGFGKTSNYSQGLFKTIMMVVRNESWYGLFKGLWPSQIKAAANSGCAFLFYEMFCDLIRRNKYTED